MTSSFPDITNYLISQIDHNEQLCRDCLKEDSPVSVIGETAIEQVGREISQRGTPLCQNRKKVIIRDISNAFSSLCRTALSNDPQEDVDNPRDFVALFKKYSPLISPFFDAICSLTLSKSSPLLLTSLRNRCFLQGVQNVIVCATPEQIEHLLSTYTGTTVSCWFFLFVSGEKERAFVKRVFENSNEATKSLLAQNLATCVEHNLIGYFGLKRNLEDYLDPLPTNMQELFLKGILRALSNLENLAIIKKNLKGKTLAQLATHCPLPAMLEGQDEIILEESRNNLGDEKSSVDCPSQPASMKNRGQVGLLFLKSFFSKLSQDERDAYVKGIWQQILTSSNPELMSFLEDSDWQFLFRYFLTLCSPATLSSLFHVVGELLLSNDTSLSFALFKNAEFLTNVLDCLPSFEKGLIIDLLVNMVTKQGSCEERGQRWQALCSTKASVTFVRTYLRKKELLTDLTSRLQNVSFREKMLLNPASASFIAFLTNTEERQNVAVLVCNDLYRNSSLFQAALNDEELSLLAGIPNLASNFRAQLIREWSTNEAFLLASFRHKNMLVLLKDFIDSLKGEPQTCFYQKLASLIFTPYKGALPLFSLLELEEGILLLDSIQISFGCRSLTCNGKNYSNFPSLLAFSLIIPSPVKSLQVAIRSKKGRELVTRLSSMIPHYTSEMSQALLACEKGRANLTLLMLSPSGSSFVENFVTNIAEENSWEVGEKILALFIFQYKQGTTLLDTYFQNNELCTSFLAKLLGSSLQKNDLRTARELVRRKAALLPFDLEEVRKRLTVGELLALSISYEKIEDIKVGESYALDETHFYTDWLLLKLKFSHVPSSPLEEKITKVQSTYPKQTWDGLLTILRTVMDQKTALGLPVDDGERADFYQNFENLLQAIFAQIENQRDLAYPILEQLSNIASTEIGTWMSSALCVLEKASHPTPEQTNCGKESFSLELLRMRESIAHYLGKNAIAKRNIPKNNEMLFWDDYLRTFKPVFKLPNYFPTTDRPPTYEFSEEEIEQAKKDFSTLYTPATVMIMGRLWLMKPINLKQFQTLYPEAVYPLNSETALPKSEALASWLTKLKILKELT